MATLKLRNCTKFDLRYKIVIFGATWHYLKSGKEGAELNKPTTYTLRVEVNNEPGSSCSRAAVNPDGTYYAVYGGGKISILTESQAQNYGKNDNNPNIIIWFPEPKIPKNIDGQIEWEMLFSRSNPSDETLQFEFEETIGFSDKVSNTHQLTIEKSQSSEFSIGASFAVNEADISGSASTSIGSSTTDFHEKLTESELYGAKTHKLSFSLEKGKSLAVWQPYINVLGHKIWLDHIEYREVGTGQPDDIKFDPAKLSLTYFPKP